MSEKENYTMELEITDETHSAELGRYVSFVRASLSNAAKDLVRKAKVAYAQNNMNESMDEMIDEGREEEIERATEQHSTRRNPYDELTDWTFGDEPYIAHINDEKLAEAMKRLPEKWLNIIIMSENYGIPLKVIAEKYDTTEASVKVMKNNGFKRLKDLMNK